MILLLKWQTLVEMRELQKELGGKIYELRQLQVELSRRNMKEDPVESVENLKSTISMLERENAKLKVTT